MELKDAYFDGNVFSLEFFEVPSYIIKVVKKYIAELTNDYAFFCGLNFLSPLSTYTGH